MRKTTNQRDRLLQIEKLECRCFPSAVLPAVAAAPIVAAASSVAIESTAVPSPAAHAAAGAIFVSPTFASPAATNAPAASGNLPNVVGSQGVFSPAAASADLSAEAAIPALGGSISSAIAAVYGTQQANLNYIQDVPSQYAWLLLNL